MNITLLNPTHLLYHALKPTIDSEVELEKPIYCGLCGVLSEKMVVWNITTKFSDLEIFAEKENINYLCSACHFALGHIRDLHKAYLLTANEGFSILQFDDQPDKQISLGNKKIVSRYFLKDFLLSPPTNDPWVLMLQSRMNPQHSLLRAKVNYGYCDTLWVNDGITTYGIPSEGLEQLLSALEQVKMSKGLYPYLFNERAIRKDHAEYETWEKIESIISKHRHTHYLSFLYDRVIPPQKYILDLSTAKN